MNMINESQAHAHTLIQNKMENSVHSGWFYSSENG